MRIITLNINGIRAGARKGFFSWMTRQKADVICVQETKAQFDQIADDPIFFPRNYHYYHADAARKWMPVKSRVQGIPELDAGR